MFEADTLLVQPVLAILRLKESWTKILQSDSIDLCSSVMKQSLANQGHRVYLQMKILQIRC